MIATAIAIAMLLLGGITAAPTVSATGADNGRTPSPVDVAYAIAAEHGATAVRQPSQDIMAIILAEDPATTAVAEYEGPGCGTFDVEPCYIVMHIDGSYDVGP